MATVVKEEDDKHDAEFEYHLSLYKSMKIRYALGHIGCLSLNADKIAPIHTAVLMKIKNAIDNTNSSYSEENTVNDLLTGSLHFVEDTHRDASMEAAQETQTIPRIPPIGNKVVVVPLQRYQLCAELESNKEHTALIQIPGPPPYKNEGPESGLCIYVPPHVEFAAKAAMAKFLKTGKSPIYNVTIQELNDPTLIMEAQSLFGNDVGKIVFDKHYEPCCWKMSNADGKETEVWMRVFESGRAMHMEIPDIWDIKKSKESVDSPGDMQVKHIMNHLFTAVKNDNFGKLRHQVSRDAIAALQEQYSRVNPNDDAEFSNLWSWDQISFAASSALESRDLFCMLRFLWAYISKTYGYKITGDKMSAMAQISNLDKYVRKEVVALSESGMKEWTMVDSEHTKYEDMQEE